VAAVLLAPVEPAVAPDDAAGEAAELEEEAEPPEAVEPAATGVPVVVPLASMLVVAVVGGGVAAAVPEAAPVVNVVPVAPVVPVPVVVPVPAAAPVPEVVPIPEVVPVLEVEFAVGVVAELVPAAVESAVGDVELFADELVVAPRPAVEASADDDVVPVDVRVVEASNGVLPVGEAGINGGAVIWRAAVKGVETPSADEVTCVAPAAPVAIAAAVRIFATTPVAPRPPIPPTA
jgi:hypothetical protein